jgi:hypothetical protein
VAGNLSEREGETQASLIRALVSLEVLQTAVIHTTASTMKDQKCKLILPRVTLPIAHAFSRFLQTMTKALLNTADNRAG